MTLSNDIIKKDKLPLALKKSKEDLDELKEKGKKYTDNYFNEYFKYSYLLIYLGKYSQAEIHLKCIEENLYDDVTKPGSNDEATFLHLTGVLEYFSGKYSSAIEKLEFALEIRKKYSSNKLPLADTYRSLGNVFALIGNYTQAELCYYKAISLTLNKKIESYLLPLTFTELGAAYWLSGKNDDAKRCILLSKHFLNQYQYNLNHLLHSKNESLLGLIDWRNANNDFTNSKKIYTTALYNLNEGLKMKKQAFDSDENHSEIANIYSNMGIIYTKIGDYNKAIKLHNKALTIRKNVFEYVKKRGEEYHHPDIARGFHDIGCTCLAEGKYYDALIYFQESIIAVVKGFVERKNLVKNPSAPKLKNIDSARYLLASINKKAQVFWNLYKLHNDVAQLKRAAKTIDDAIKLIHVINNNPDQKKGDFFYFKMARAINEKMLLFHDEICRKKLSGFPLENLEEVFNEFEKIRMFSLKEDLRDRIVRLNLEEDISDSYLKANREKTNLVLNFEKILLSEKEKISILKKRNKELEQFYYRISIVETLLSEVDNKIKENNKIKKELDSFEKTNVNLKNIQEKAFHPDSRAAIIIFLVCKFDIFAIVITRSNINLINLCYNENNQMIEGRKKDTLDRAKEIRQSLETTPDHFVIHEKLNFTTNAYQLYLNIIKPIKSFLQKKNRIYIIPDKEIAYIPFDALITKQINIEKPYSEYPYLIHQYNISYHYSTTLLCGPSLFSHEKETKISQKIFLLGLAPKPTSGLQPLYHTIKTLEELKEGLKKNQANKFRKKVKVFTGNQATIASYQENANSSVIIHISSHTNTPRYSVSILNTEIQLYQDKLKVNQILFSKLSAKLVLLMCCKTGAFFDDNIVPLNKAFMIAGAANIIYTLFDFLDLKVTREMILSFYIKILNGETFGKALRLAKIEVITEKTKGSVSPQVWAGISLMGEQLDSLEEPV